MRLLQLNPDYEPLWRGLASALFRARTGLSLGYGYRGKVDESNADAVLGKHPTPEHVAQLALARFLRAETVRAAARGGGGAARDDASQPVRAFLEQLIAWYGAMAAHTYGSASRHYRPDRKKARALADEAGRLLAAHEPDTADPDAEDNVLGSSPRRMAALLTRVTGMRCAVLDAAEGELRTRRVARKVEGEDGSGEGEPGATPAEFEPPSLDAHVGKPPRTELYLAGALRDNVVACLESEAEPAGAVVVRCAEDATFAVAVPDSRLPWIERPAALGMVLDAVLSGVHARAVVAVFALPDGLAPYLAREAESWRRGGESSEAHAAGAGGGSGAEEAAAAAQAEEAEEAAAAAQAEEAAAAAQAEEAAQAAPRADEADEAADRADEADEAADRADEADEAADRADEADEAADRADEADESDEADAAAPAAALDGYLWVTIPPKAKAERALSKAVHRLRRALGKASGRACELLEVDVALLMALLLAPEGSLRDDCWAVLADLSQDALPGPDLLRLRAALGLLQRDLTDEQMMAQAGRRGLVVVHRNENPCTLRILLPEPSDLLAEAATLLAAFCERHQLECTPEGTYACWRVHRGAAKPGWVSAPAPVRRMEEAEEVAGAEAAAAAEEEAGAAQTSPALGLVQETTHVRGARAEDADSDETRRTALARPAFRRGLALRAADREEALGEEGGSMRRLLRALLDQAHDASPDLRDFGL